MSLFNPADPSHQQFPYVLGTTVLGASGDSGPIDVTGFRQLVLRGNVTAAGGPGSIVEVDELFPDGTWFNPGGTQSLSAVGAFRFFVTTPSTPTVRVRWNIAGPGPTTTLSLLGQS